LEKRKLKQKEKGRLGREGSRKLDLTGKLTEKEGWANLEAFRKGRGHVGGRGGGVRN